MSGVRNVSQGLNIDWEQPGIELRDLKAGCLLQDNDAIEVHVFFSFHSYQNASMGWLVFFSNFYSVVARREVIHEKAIVNYVEFYV